MVRNASSVDFRTQKPTILVVDDTAVTREIVKSVLHRVGYKTLDVADGGAALDLLNQMAVDALVTDLDMPRVPGQKLISRLRSGVVPLLSDIPIVVMSTESDPETQSQVQKLGANFFVAKPIHSKHLLQVIQRALELN